MIVRPIFFKKGFTDGRDLCGVDEMGRDCLFISKDMLDLNTLYYIQTKRGNINLAGKSSDNIKDIATQLNTALSTPFFFTEKRIKMYPAFVMLCSSGSINEKARTFVERELNDHRIRFLDVDDLIPMIDKHYPEFWYGIDSDKFPYLKNLKIRLADFCEINALSELVPREQISATSSDEVYVNLHLTRMKTKRKKIRGTFYEIPDFEEIPVQGILQKNDPLNLILGDAGSGKSTTLRRLAIELAKKSLSSSGAIVVPIYLRAKELLENADRLVKICAEHTCKLTETNNPAFSSDELREGNLTIFVDGLDEIASEEGKSEVVSKIIQFSSEYPACKVILSSRNISSINKIEGTNLFISYNIGAISWKQAEKLVENLKKGNILNKKTLAETLRKMQEVHGIELSPLLVTVFVATSDLSGFDIPANITELFKKYTELMLGRWDSGKGINQQFHGPFKDFLTKKIAFEMHRSKETKINIRTLTDTLRTEIEERGHEANIDQLTEEIIYRSGLFRILGDEVEFRHFMLQEFFAGRAMDDDEFIKAVVSDEWWRKPLMFYFGENADNYRLLSSAIKHSETLTGQELYKAAITMGISLQACYLIKSNKRYEVLKWIVEKLAVTKEQLFEGENTDSIVAKMPNAQFIHYYIYGRDAVACHKLPEMITDFLDDWSMRDFTEDYMESLVFWVIAGLIECQYVKEAKKLISGFKPSDTRFLLAIHLGAYSIGRVQLVDKERQKIAEKICNSLEPVVNPLRNELIEEFRSQLLEIRNGVIKSIPDE